MQGTALRYLPAPEGGWHRITTWVTWVAALWAVATFIMVAIVTPRMDPECYSDGTSVTICPLPEDRNPALTGLLEARWPDLGAWTTLAGVAGVLLLLAAVGASIFLSTIEPWSSTGGAPNTVVLQASLAGIGLGLISAGLGYVRPLVVFGFVAAGVLAWGFGALLCRAFVRSLRDRYAKHLRRARLRERGKRLLAEVIDVYWLRGAGTSDLLLFEVTARQCDEPRMFDGLIRLPRADAPVIGGTIFVYTDGASYHPTGIDVVMEQDPASVRDPDVEQRYPDLSPY